MLEAPQPRLPEPGDTIGGSYEIESVLGEGGFGAVYQARHVRSGRAVAVKWLLPSVAKDAESLQRFMVEARATAAIEHPNVVTIIDVDEEQGSPYLVMELLRGESLRERIARTGPLAPEEAVDRLLEAMHGVAGAHAEGVVHRDLKPDNIFLCAGKEGEPRPSKVLDFGISKAAHANVSGVQTQTGMVVGTPAYMSPEQMSSPRVAEPMFDVYAMGIVLYEALTGNPPYRSESLFDIVRQIGQGGAPPPSSVNASVSSDLDALVLRTFHVEAAMRPATMRDLILELETLRSRRLLSSGVPFDPPTLTEGLEPVAVASGARAVPGVTAGRPRPSSRPPSATGPRPVAATRPMPGVSPSSIPPPMGAPASGIVPATAAASTSGALPANVLAQAAPATPAPFPSVSSVAPPQREAAEAPPSKVRRLWPLVLVGVVVGLAGAGVAAAVLLPAEGSTAYPSTVQPSTAEPAAVTPTPASTEPEPTAAPEPAAAEGATIEAEGQVFHLYPDDHAALLATAGQDGIEVVHVTLPERALAPRTGAGVRVEGERQSAPFTYMSPGGERSVPSLHAVSLERAPDVSLEVPPGWRVGARRPSRRTARPEPETPRVNLPSRLAPATPRMSEDEI